MKISQLFRSTTLIIWIFVKFSENSHNSTLLKIDVFSQILQWKHYASEKDTKMQRLKLVAKPLQCAREIFMCAHEIFETCHLRTRDLRRCTREIQKNNFFGLLLFNCHNLCKTRIILAHARFSCAHTRIWVSLKSTISHASQKRSFRRWPTSFDSLS